MGLVPFAVGNSIEISNSFKNNSHKSRYTPQESEQVTAPPWPVASILDSILLLKSSLARGSVETYGSVRTTCSDPRLVYYCRHFCVFPLAVVIYRTRHQRDAVRWPKGILKTQTPSTCHKLNCNTLCHKHEPALYERLSDKMEISMGSLRRNSDVYNKIRGGVFSP